MSCICIKNRDIYSKIILRFLPRPNKVTETVKNINLKIE